MCPIKSVNDWSLVPGQVTSTGPEYCMLNCISRVNCCCYSLILQVYTLYSARSIYDWVKLMFASLLFRYQHCVFTSCFFKVFAFPYYIHYILLIIVLLYLKYRSKYCLKVRSSIKLRNFDVTYGTSYNIDSSFSGKSHNICYMFNMVITLYC